ncbi:hypothetical protein NDN08_000361 [Rhodosorus marinus]|uniref:Protein kinase domain-containing protein n=1 Tax=Rhodosorus marinus TaxID=101924 RepID=A0AAV8UMU9_9RHOD|nr:hypothetical protein NDN08_000361 [Rhodosorus marinus]
MNGLVLSKHEDECSPADWCVPLLCCNVKTDRTTSSCRIDPINLELFCDEADLRSLTSRLGQVLKRNVEDYYDLGAKIGEGSNGTVRFGTNRKTGERVAIKVTDMSNLQAEQLLDMLVDVLILFLVNHKGIVKPIDYFESDRHVYLVVEYLAGGTLEERVINKRDNLREEEVKDIMRALFNAVNSLHDKDIVHRDLKIDNIVCTSASVPWSPKLIDLGSGILVDDCKTISGCGHSAVLYLAPEQVMNQPYTKAVDMWACGVVLYWLIEKVHPFFENNFGDIFRKIQKCELELGPIWDDYSPETRDLLYSLLKVNPAERLTAKDALNHPFVREDGAVEAGDESAFVRSNSITGPAKSLLRHLREGFPTKKTSGSSGSANGSMSSQILTPGTPTRRASGGSPSTRSFGCESPAVPVQKGSPKGAGRIGTVEFLAPSPSSTSSDTSERGSPRRARKYKAQAKSLLSKVSRKLQGPKSDGMFATDPTSMRRKSAAA